MIKVVAKRYIKAGRMEEYLALAKTLVDQTRKEPGCLDYALCVNQDEYVAAMMETWESPEALKVHFGVLQAGNWGEKLGAYADPEKPAGIEKFEVIY